MIHVAGKVDPVEDIDVINFELALADITQIEKRLERIAKGRAKTKEEMASNEVRLSLLVAASRMYPGGTNIQAVLWCHIHPPGQSSAYHESASKPPSLAACMSKEDQKMCKGS